MITLPPGLYPVSFCTYLDNLDLRLCDCHIFGLHFDWLRVHTSLQAFHCLDLSCTAVDDMDDLVQIVLHLDNGFRPKT